MIDYPADLFTIQPPPPDNAGRDFTAEKAGARFHVYSHANAMNSSVEELQAEDVLDIGDAAAVKNNGADWYQVMATKGTDTILRRVLLSEGGAMVHRLEIAYPKTAAASFEPIVARMIKSFRVDPAIPERAANAAGSPVSPEATKPVTRQPEAKRPQASKPAWQRFDSIALGMRIPGYSGKAGVSAEVPASWTKSDMPEPNAIEFQGLEATGDDVLHVTIRAERRRSGVTLASMAKALTTRLAASADSFRARDERNAQVALRPAVLLSLQYAGSDSPDLLFEDIAIVEAGELFYIIEFGAPESRYAASQQRLHPSDRDASASRSECDGDCPRDIARRPPRFVEADPERDCCVRPHCHGDISGPGAAGSRTRGAGSSVADAKPSDPMWQAMLQIAYRFSAPSGHHPIRYDPATLEAEFWSLRTQEYSFSQIITWKNGRQLTSVHRDHAAIV